jgi:hypothetical protein
MDVQEYGDDFPLYLDHTRPLFISAFGRKGSGKSAFNREIYRSYPGDKLAIDVNGNAEPGEDAQKITAADLRKQWPAPDTMPGERRKPRNLHFLADPGSATYEDDLDKAVGMALLPQKHPVMVWAGECTELMPKGRTGPAVRRLLRQSRHYTMSVLFDDPRPMWIDRLVLTQSNLIALFELPEPDDRKRVAQATGHNARKFDEICEETWARGEYWFLLINMDAPRGKRLWRMAPLPITAAAGQPGR